MVGTVGNARTLDALAVEGVAVGKEAVLVDLRDGRVGGRSEPEQMELGRRKTR